MFPSLLWLSETHPKNHRIAAQVFDDVNLDRLLPPATVKKMADPCTPEEILARHALFRCLEDPETAQTFERLDVALSAYGRTQDALRQAETEYERLILFVECAKNYRQVLEALRALPAEVPFSRGLHEFAACDESRAFLASFDERIELADNCLTSICTVNSDVILNDVTLRAPNSNRADPEKSVCDTISEMATRLGITATRTAKSKSLFPDEALSGGMAQLYPEAFAALRDFRASVKSHMQTEVLGLREELQFYLSVRSLAQKAAKAGVPQCYPTLSESRVYRAVRAHDVSLMLKGEVTIVPNDIDFSESDRVCFLTGANGGGKTTYIRTITINLILFLAGCPIFADSARIYPFRQVFTHFTTDERFDGSGRLFDEQKRIDEILTIAEKDSFLLLNETFSGTDDKKGCEMTLAYTEKFKELGCFSLFVTHFHEVNDRGYTVFNTVIDVSSDNRRTFRIVKSDAMRSSYAADILRKYSITKEDLERRLGKQ